MPIVLRDYQAIAFATARTRMSEGLKRFIFQAPTGAGKTILAVAVIDSALSRGRQILFQAHRGELVEQPYEELVEHGIPRDKIALHIGGEKIVNPNAPIHIGTVQTLHRRALPTPGIIISDECHRAVGPTHLAILDSFPEAYRVGLTATPCRIDGKGLGIAYDEIIVVAQPEELVKLGAIVEPKIYTVADDQLPDLRGIGRTMGDFQKEGLSKSVGKAHLIDSIVENWRLRAKGLRTICFAVDRPHSKSIVEKFVAAGIRAAHVDGSTPKKLRKALFKALADGELDVLSQVEIAIEGINIPSVKCVILARPTQSLTIYLQSIGRAVRPWGGLIPVVLDHAGNALFHGHPMQNREYSLTGTVTKTKVALCKTCPSCYLMVKPSASTCVECGHVFGAEAEGQNLKTINGLLEALTPERILAQQRVAWDKWKDEARDNGRSMTWVLTKYLTRYKAMPPKAWQEEKIVFDLETKKRLILSLTKKQQFMGKPWQWVELEYQRRTGEKINA